MKQIFIVLALFFALLEGYSQTPAFNYAGAYASLENLTDKAQRSRLKADIQAAQTLLDQLVGKRHLPYFQTMIDAINCQDCGSPIGIDIVSPSVGDSININQWFSVQFTRTGEDEHTPYLHIHNTSTGYVKLKVGYAGTIYGTYNDVLAGGNTHLEIKIKALNGKAPSSWAAIRIRPEAIGTLNLSNYISGSAENYTTISIPLTDFDPSIDFSAIRYFEFPYSADAKEFELAINSIRFVGGSTPFEWFGENHYSNPHDGSISPIFAEIIDVIPDAVYADTLFLYVNDTLRDFSTVEPYTLMYESPYIGTVPLYTVLKDINGNLSTSDTLQIKFYKAELLEIVLEFAATPTYTVVDKSVLLYDKDFAYSLTLDDGRNDHYDYAFPLLNGGTVEEVAEAFPGLTYTDGTGQDKKFNAGLAWNAVSTSYADIHINTPSYITWPELIEMYDAGWDVYNHGYSHNTTLQGADVAYEIMANDTAIRINTTTETHPPIETNHFILPSADLNFTTPAFDYGYKSIYSNTSTFSGFPDGVIVNESTDVSNLTMYRRLLSDELHNPSNIMDYINQAANASIGNAHYWINDFTHRVDTSITGASLTWNTFKYYLQTIESTYGKSGDDSMWFASLAQVQEYITLRNTAFVSRYVNKNYVTIKINIADIPIHIRRKELSLLLDSDLPILNATINFNGSATYNSMETSNQLINIKWD